MPHHFAKQLRAIILAIVILLATGMASAQEGAHRFLVFDLGIHQLGQEVVRTLQVSDALERDRSDAAKNKRLAARRDFQDAKENLSKAVTAFLQFKIAEFDRYSAQVDILHDWVIKAEKNLQEVLKVSRPEMKSEIEVFSRELKELSRDPTGTLSTSFEIKKRENELYKEIVAVRAKWFAELEVAYIKAARAHEFFSGILGATELAPYADILPGSRSRLTSGYGGRSNWVSVYLLHLIDRLLDITRKDPKVLISLSENDDNALNIRERKIILELVVREAYEHPFYNPATDRPFVGAISRRALGDRIIENILEYLTDSPVGKSVDYQGRLKEDPSSYYQATFQEVKKNLSSELEKLESTVAGYLPSGSEPTPQQFFLAVSLAFQKEGQRAAELFRDKYLLADEGFWDTGLGILLRASNMSPSANPKEDLAYVKNNVEQYITYSDNIAQLFSTVSKQSDPSKLSPNTIEKLRAFDFIVESEDETTGEKRLTYHVPNSLNGIGDFMRGNQTELKIPEASLLDAIDAKAVAMTLATSYLPGLGAEWLVSKVGANSNWSATLAKFLIEAGVSATSDVVTEAAEHYQTDKKFSAEWEKILLRSFVMGAFQEVAGSAFEKQLTGLVRESGDTWKGSAFGEFMRRALKENPSRARSIYEFVQDNGRMVQDVSIGLAFESVAFGETLNLAQFQSGLISGALAKSVNRRAELSVEKIKKALRAERHRKGKGKGNGEESLSFMADAMDADPKLADEIILRQKKLAEAEDETVRRYAEVVKTESDSAERHYELMVENEFPWLDTQTLLQKGGVSKEKIEEVGKIRWRTIDNIGHAAREYRTFVVQRSFEKYYNAEMKRNGNNHDAAAEMALKRQLWELDMINRGLVIPGSRDAISDIDRSGQHVAMRKDMVEMWDMHARQFDGRELLTAGEAIDANEYYNVFPFIQEGLSFHKEMAGFKLKQDEFFVAGLNHEEAMHVIALSGAMRGLSEAQMDTYIGNLKDRIAGSIGGKELAAGRKDVQGFVARAKLAKEHLLRSRAEIVEIARSQGQHDPDNPHADLQRAKDELYQRRLEEIQEDRWRLFLLEEEGRPEGGIGPRKPPSEEALRLRAEILRKVAIALRDGVNTYTSPVTLDIVISRVQADNKGPKLGDDGKPLRDKDDKIIMEKMKISDRLSDHGFNNAEGNALAVYSKLDLEGMAFDQDSFILEHVNKFNAGIENEAKTGRAIGKYLERAFLSDKAAGIDIETIRARAETDPTRRLLEFTETLVKNKGDPAAIVDALTSFSQKSPRTAANGLAEVFYLMEQAFPRFRGMTGVVSGSMTKPESMSLASMFREMGSAVAALALTSLSEQQSTQDLVKENGGAQAHKEYLDLELHRVLQELQIKQNELDDLRKLGSEMLFRDWEKINEAAREIAYYEGTLASLPWPHPDSTIQKAIESDSEEWKSKLGRLRSEPIRGDDIDSKLDSDPNGLAYRRTKNRIAWLEYLKKKYSYDLARASAQASLNAVYEEMDLSGDWVCFKGANVEAVIEVNHDKSKSVGGFNASLVNDKESLEAPGLAFIRPEDAYVRMNGDFLDGRIRGMWWAPKVTTEPPNGIDAKAVIAARTFEARVSRNGKMLRFPIAPRHASVPIDWSSLQCRKIDLLDEERPIAIASQGPMPGDLALLNKDDAFGAVRGYYRSPDGILVDAPEMIEVFRGRTRVKTELMPPGEYRVRVTLGTKSENLNVTVQSGELTEVTLNAGGIDLIETAPTGRVASKVYIYEQGSSDGTRYQGEYDQGQVIPLPPGIYDIKLVNGGAQTIFGVRVEMGAATPVDAYWSELVLTGKEPTDQIQAVTLAQMDASALPMPTDQASGGRLRYLLGAGAYDLSVVVNGEKYKRLVQLIPGARSFETFGRAKAPVVPSSD